MVEQRNEIMKVDRQGLSELEIIAFIQSKWEALVDKSAYEKNANTQYDSQDEKMTVDLSKSQREDDSNEK